MNFGNKAFSMQKSVLKPQANQHPTLMKLFPRSNPTTYPSPLARGLGARRRTASALRNFGVCGILLALPAIMTAQASAVAAPAVVKKTLLQELNLPAIWFLVGCSLLIVWFVIDLYLKSTRSRLLPSVAVERVRLLFQRGDYQGAFDFAGVQACLFGDVVHAALKHAAAGQRASEEAAAHALAGGNAYFQTRIAYLSVIGVIAPMVGLTGTVLGMIDAFAVMGQAGASDPSKLSGAIGHVLHATAGGLIVAIPAFVFYYLLRNRVAHEIHGVSSAAVELFRRFPYEDMARKELKGGEACAARPTWSAETRADPEPSPV